MFQHSFRKRFLQLVNKLWGDKDLASAKDVVWKYLGNSEGLESISIEKYGLYIRITKEVHADTPYIHTSLSISDFDVLVVKMKEFDCFNIKAFMEEVIQACFGYDTLLIEKKFLASPMNLTKPLSAQNLPSSPDAYVYHWIYENIDKN
jgi:hypothetical protein